MNETEMKEIFERIDPKNQQGLSLLEHNVQRLMMKGQSGMGTGIVTRFYSGTPGIDNLYRGELIITYRSLDGRIEEPKESFETGEYSRVKAYFEGRRVSFRGGCLAEEQGVEAERITGASPSEAGRYRMPLITERYERFGDQPGDLAIKHCVDICNRLMEFRERVRNT